ncbi:MerR family transcriptional regulator [Caulobacter sp. KR2-114]|uniref:MerR family transcriptional regulator n=1 Tax=Caulobacter sp. KR2-114 TaxID=3400912 RepID=UPI003BFE49E0
MVEAECAPRQTGSMRIGELSRLTGVAPSRIRFYERNGVLPPAGRGLNGYREYPQTAVKRLGLIDTSQRLGFSLAEIRAALAEAAPNFPSHDALARALRAKLAALDQHLKDVRARRREIEALLRSLGD